MVAGWHRLLDRGRALRVKAGEQQSALHLGTRDRQSVVPTDERGALDSKRRHAVTGGDPGAHRPQWLDDPRHRPAAQRGIARQAGGNPAGGEHAGKQPHGGAGVLAIEWHPSGSPCGEPPASHVDPDIGPDDRDAQGAKAGFSGEHILPGRNLVDDAFPLG
jgi:hypothetical protein